MTTYQSLISNSPLSGVSMSDFLFRGSLKDLDPDVYELTQIEAERQYRKLILIASESAAPLKGRGIRGPARAPPPPPLRRAVGGQRGDGESTLRQRPAALRRPGEQPPLPRARQ